MPCARGFAGGDVTAEETTPARLDPTQQREHGLQVHQLSPAKVPQQRRCSWTRLWSFPSKLMLMHISLWNYSIYPSHLYKIPRNVALSMDVK